MYPQGTLQLILQYFTSSAAASEPRTVMASSGVFGVLLSTVTEYVSCSHFVLCADALIRDFAINSSLPIINAFIISIAN